MRNAKLLAINEFENFSYNLSVNKKGKNNLPALAWLQ